MTLPIRTFDSLYHFGTMKIEDRGDKSCEGDTLSVSIHPASWMQIMEQGGEVFKKTTETRLVDLFEYCNQNKDEIIQWGLDNGLIFEQNVCRMYFYDSESDDVRFMSFDKKDDALHEVDDMDYVESYGTDNINELLENHTSVIATLSGYGYTDEGKKQLRGHNAEVDVHDLAVMYFNEHQDKFNIDGCWWNNDLAPELLSAPAGGLFLKRLKPDEFQKIDYILEPEDEYEIMLPETTSDSPGLKM